GRAVAHRLGDVWLLATAVIEVDAAVPNEYALASFLTGVTAIALAYGLLRHRLGWPRIGTPLMGYAAVQGLGLLVAGAAFHRPLESGGWFAWPAFLVVHAIVLRLVVPDWSSLAQDAVHAIGVLVLAALGALEGRATTASWGDPASAWPWLGWMVVPAVLLFAIE